MNRIKFPLKKDMSGQKVADLQDALNVFLKRRLILRDDEHARHELIEGLKPECEAQRYGDFTRKAVSVFERERQLEPA